MDPSYNNGVGSQIPQNNPQMSGQPMQQPVMPQQPMMAPQQPISSGAGDIVLSGNDAPKKSHKGIIILIVLVVVLVLAGGGFLLWQNGVFRGNNGKIQQTASLEESYNHYVNYVLWGIESNGRPNLDAMMNVIEPYFTGLEGIALNEYVVKADQMYNDFKQAYDAREGDKLDIAVLKSYYEDYPTVKPVDMTKIIEDYVKGGVESAKEMITENYSTVGDEQYLNDYLNAEKSYADALLGIIDNAGKAGCIKNNEMVQGCYKYTDEESLTVSKTYNDVVKTKNSLFQATDVMIAVYEKLYSVGDNNA